MPGFGKKNARETMLRAIMIHISAEVLIKEADAAHVLFTQEMNNVLDSVIAAQDTELTVREYNYVMAGVHILINESGFAHEITTRWHTHDARLKPEDIRRCKEIFPKAPPPPAD